MLYNFSNGSKSYRFLLKVDVLLINNETTRGRVFIIFHGVALAMTNVQILEFYHPLLSDTDTGGGGYISPPANLPHPPQHTQH